ncbi:hypothetical protein GCM10010972_06770 [Cellulomonas carbonis]|nr:hypothetical protein GCM10010972_06770 [Cellulomonas carbonis]
MGGPLESAKGPCARAGAHVGAGPAWRDAGHLEAVCLERDGSRNVVQRPTGRNGPQTAGRSPDWVRTPHKPAGFGQLCVDVGGPAWWFDCGVWFG